MSLEIAERIAQIIPFNSIDEIKRLLGPYFIGQRRLIMSTNVSGSSFLYYAVAHRSFSVVKYFLDECGADPNSFGTERCGKRTCLSKAVSLCDKDIVEILLRRGADINGVSCGNKTAVATACSMKHLEMTKFLVENGANISHQNDNGNEALISSLYKYEIFKYLVMNGANINLVDTEGCTVLMHAITAHQNDIILFLLTRKDIDIKIKNQYDEDALSLSLHFCSDTIIQEIIYHGDYSKHEVMKACEWETCFCYIYGGHAKSNALWQKVLWLRDLPMDTPIFSGLLPKQESDNDIRLFSEEHRQALLYMRALYGPRHVLTLRATAIVLKFVRGYQNFLEIFKPFSKILHSLNIREFLQIQKHVENALREYIFNFSQEAISLEEFFKMLTDYTLTFCAKHEQPMTPSTRNFYDTRFENFKNFFIRITSIIMKKYACYIDIIHREIEKFLRTHWKYSTGYSLAQICLKTKQINSFRMFLSCGAEVDQTDENDETILHYLLDSKFLRKREFIELVVDVGFDFSRVTFSKYCLPCRMKKEGFLFYPEECNTLQCLAANVICQKTIFGENFFPSRLRTIIKTHMYI